MPAVHKKPEPLYDLSARPLCPVCGHASYSPAGVHPQCAMRAADLVQINRLKARKTLKPKASATQPGRFEKQCPRCRRIHHIRKQVCTCGKSFLIKERE